MMLRDVLLTLFFSLPCLAAKPLKLTPLKPIKTTTLEIARIDVELISLQEGAVISEVHGKLGDCPECIRGAAIKGDFGFRLEGKTKTALKPFFKFTNKVRMNTCPRGPLDPGQTLTCEFVFAKKPLKMIVKIAANTP